MELAATSGIPDMIQLGLDNGGTVDDKCKVLHPISHLTYSN